MRAVGRAVVVPRRGELLVCMGASLALGVLGVLVAANIPPPGRDAPPGPIIDAVGYLRYASVVVPLAFAAILGTSLIAGEIEARTAALAWAIALSRRRWLAEMTGCGIFLLLLLWLPIGSSERILAMNLTPLQEAQTSPFGLDPSATLVLFRALLMFSVVCLVGAVTGRVMTTLLAGLVAGIVALALLEVVFLAWRGAQVSTIDPTMAGSLPLGTQVATLDGRLVDKAEAQSALSMGSDFGQRYELVSVGLSPSSRAEIIAVQSAAAALGSAGFLLATALVIERRRP